MTIRVIDIETTGTDPNTDAIVEIASIDIRSDGSFGNSLEYLINPERPIPAAASAIHHLIDDDVRDHRVIGNAIGHFIGADAYVAHNCAFERSFLDRHIGADAKWICTYKCALRVWPDLASYSNQALRYHHGLINPLNVQRATIDPHRALSDVIVTGAIFLKLLQASKWDDLIRWTSEPALMTKFSFGKHRGQKLSDVPGDYLDWIVSKSDLDNDVKFSAQTELTRRASQPQ
jgi:exodeoxyribonuclease X